MKLNLTREEVVAALRCCATDMDCAGNCAFFGLNSPSEDCSQRKNNTAADLIENQQREIDALRQANEGLRFNLAAAAGSNKPLTLDELRAMDGKPVYMVDLTGGTLWNQWIIFARSDETGFCPRGGGWFSASRYGETWIAYRRELEVTVK